MERVAGKGWRRSLSLLAVLGMAGTAWGVTVTLAPEADAFFHKDAPMEAHGLDVYLSTSQNRESALRFDVSGVSTNVRSATLRLFCTQHDETDGDKPVIALRMDDITWDEATATGADMAHEIPFVNGQSAWVATNDARFAGLSVVCATNRWVEFDVTKAVAAAARTTGKAGFFLYQPCVNATAANASAFTPDCFASKETTSFPKQIPQLVVDFDGDGGQAPGAAEEVEVVVSDDFVIEGGKIRNDRYFLAGGGREFVMKFDVGAYAGRVVSATLRLVGADMPNPVASSLDLILLDSGDWSESSVTMSSLPAGVEYYHSFPSAAELPDNRLRFGQSFSGDGTNDYDVTALVQRGASFASGCLTLQGCVPANYAIGHSRDAADESVRPRLSLKVRKSAVSVVRDANDGVLVSWPSAAGAEAWHVERAVDPDGPWTRVVESAAETSAYDASCPCRGTWWYRVVAVADGEETPSMPTLFQERPVWETRRALWFSSPFNDNGGKRDTSYYSGAEIQCGCPGENRAIDVYLAFDATGLENVSSARVRLKSSRRSVQCDELRVLGMVTDAWNPTNVTWNANVPGFSHVVPVPSAEMEHEIARLKYDVGSSVAFAMSMEIDVTELARRAARTGGLVTLMLAQTYPSGWRFFHSTESGENPPTLVYSAPTGLNGLRAEVDMTRDPPAAVLSWGAGPTGTVYSLTATTTRDGREKTLASGIEATSHVDDKALPEETVYALTATLPNGQTVRRVLTNTLDTASATVYPMADTYVHNGLPDSRFGTASKMILKYGDGWGTREAFFKFDLSPIPSDTVATTLTVTPYGFGDFSGDESLCFRVAEDVQVDGGFWTDETAPTWREQIPDRATHTEMDSAADRIVPFGQLADGVPIVLDVTDWVADAKAAGRTSLVVHAHLHDSHWLANCALYSMENPMCYRAPHLTAHRAKWGRNGFLIQIR